MSAASFCGRCGGALDSGGQAVSSHDACRAAQALEPPRFCPYCARRMKVQVLPAGWHATCVQHGTVR